MLAIGSKLNSKLDHFSLPAFGSTILINTQRQNNQQRTQ